MDSNKQLKIAMVVRSFSVSGGLELYTHKLVEGLIERGHFVKVICEENSSTLNHANLSFHYFSGPPIGTRKAKRLKHYFESATTALKQAGDFDIVHSQHLPMVGANVVTFHNHSVPHLYKVGKKWENLLNCAKSRFVLHYRLRDHYDRILVNDGQCLVFSAKVCRDDYYTNYNVSNSKPSVVAYPGAQLAQSAKDEPEELNFEPDNSLPGREPFSFLFVGRGYRKKGLDILLAACHKLRREGKLFKLVVAGIRYKTFDKVRLRSMDLEGIVTYRGFEKNMAPLFSRAQAIILPSRVEPFGMAALQGMLAGLAPIVSRASGVSETIDKDMTGLILENHLSVDELAHHMTYLMSDRDRARRMGEAAQKLAENFTWDKTVDATIKAYEIVFDSKALVGQGGSREELKSKSLN